MSLKSLDAICLRGILKREEVSFEFNGGIYTGTCGARDTMRGLTEGGYVDEQEFSILVPVESFNALVAKPAETSKVAVCVDVDGIPCAVADATEARVWCRVVKVGRALAGLTYTLATIQR